MWNLKKYHISKHLLLIEMCAKKAFAIEAENNLKRKILDGCQAWCDNKIIIISTT